MDNILIAHNLRSCYNVGSLLRTCDGLGVSMIMTGTTPFPLLDKDLRLPHVAERAHKQIAKTALGAEQSVDWRRSESLEVTIEQLNSDGYTIGALEQTTDANSIANIKAPQSWALIVGHEVDGIDPETLEVVDQHWQIPMRGQKQSLNVTIAAAIAIWQLQQK